METRVLTNGRQAITTKYLGPTNFRGSRIVAKAEGGRRVVVSWDYALNTNDNHGAACAALVAKLGWSGEWRGSATADGYAFICMDGYAQCALPGHVHGNGGAS